MATAETALHALPRTGLELIDPAVYERGGPPHEAWSALRRLPEIPRFEPTGYEPFWPITRHAEICSISKRPQLYRNAPGIVLLREEDIAFRRSGEGLAAMRTIIEMDPPEHRVYRKVASPWFTPRALARVDEAVEASARELVDGLRARAEGREGTCDFVQEIAVPHPLRILSTILGIERELEPTVLRLTNQLFAADDPDLQRPAADRRQALMELGLELYQLFTRIIEDRRTRPRDDLATLLACAKIDGAPMPPMETVGYYLIVFTAGHDTTKNALAGGMHLFLDHPSEFAKLQRNPERVNGAVEEIVRMVSPVNYMKRTTAAETEIAGTRIPAGENLILFYASANRDERVFEDPFAFRIDRRPNPHVGFGIGEHFCLGAHLARRSQRALWRELSRRLEWVEPAGEPAWIRSNFVVGLKRLPIRYRLRPDA